MSQTTNQNDALRQIKFWLFTGIGAAVMIASIVGAVFTRQFVGSAKSAAGVVMQLNAGGSHPQVEFTTDAGEVVSYAQNGMIANYRQGDAVEVLYNPQQPREAAVNNFWALWGFTILEFALGAVFVVMAQVAVRRPDLVS